MFSKDMVLIELEKRIQGKEKLAEKDKKRGSGFWIQHILDLPKNINHSQLTKIVSHFFVKVLVNRFLTSSVII